MSRVFSENGQIKLTDNSGKLIWATNLAPVNLLPDSSRIITTRTLTWPDFQKGNAYLFDGQAGSTSACVSFITITSPQTYTSGDILLGTVPSGVNHIFVEVVMTRTKAPSSLIGLPTPANVPEGVVISLDGGSLLVESTGPYRRLLTIHRSGNNVYARLQQTVFAGGPSFSWVPGNQVQNNAGGYRDGWTWGVSPNSFPASQRDAKSSGNIQKWRGGSNQCSLADNTDYSVSYSANITITPAYIIQ